LFCFVNIGYSVIVFEASVIFYDDKDYFDWFLFSFSFDILVLKEKISVNKAIKTKLYKF